MRVKISFLWLFLIIVFSLGVNPVVGLDKAPDFTLVDINGGQFKLSTHVGKVVLIDFFGTRCPNCILEIPHLKILYNKYPQDQFGIISISVYDTNEELRNFVQEHDMPWTVARDTSPPVSDKYNVYPLPTLFIIDTEGYIRKKYEIEVVEASVLISQIDLLLSGTGNGDSNGNSNGDSTGDSDTGHHGPPYTLIAVIGVGVVVFLVIGLVVAGQLLGWSEPAKKRRSRKRKR